MISGAHLRAALHAMSLDPGANANERERLGHVTYYLTEKTADRIAERLNQTEPYVVWSNEHRAWWKWGRAGYTVHLADAGHYAREDALLIAADARGGWRPGEEPPEIAVRLADALETEATTAARRAGT